MQCTFITHKVHKIFTDFQNGSKWLEKKEEATSSHFRPEHTCILLVFSGVFGVEQTNHKTNSIPADVAAMLDNTSSANGGGGEDSD